MAGMRGDDQQPDSMFSLRVGGAARAARSSVVSDPSARGRDPIRQLVDEILRGLSRDFARLYARVGRPSIQPERLLRAQLLQIFYAPVRRDVRAGNVLVRSLARGAPTLCRSRQEPRSRHGSTRCQDGASCQRHAFI